MAQLFQTNFDSFDGLEQVVKTIEQFSPERFQYAIFNTHHRLKTTEIIRLDCRVVEATARLKEQLVNLSEFAENFNNEFVTTNNEFFNSAYVLLRKIRSGTKQIKEIYSKFTSGMSSSFPVMQRTTTSSVYDRSSLGNAEYAKPLFPLSDSTTSVVTDLYDHLKEFFALLHNALLCCLVVIREENDIRRHPEFCCQLYNDYKDKHYRQIKNFVKSIDIYTKEFAAENNAAISLREQSKSEEEFSQKGFHNLLQSDVNALATKEIVQKIKNGDYTQEEMLLWSDCTTIDLVRSIIANFDTYLPEDFHRKELPSYLVASLLLWSHPKEAKGFVTYVKKQYNGQYTVPNNSAVNQMKNKIFLGNEKVDEYNFLISQWDHA